MSEFSWKALAATLAQSDYLQPGDDLSTQRGIVATAAAIAERMSYCDRMHHVTWKPVRLQEASQAPTVALDASKSSPGPGGFKIAQPAPTPSLPPSDGAAEALPAPEMLRRLRTPIPLEPQSDWF